MKRLPVKTLALLSIMQLFASAAAATDFAVNGIFYKVISSTSVMVMPETYIPENTGEISMGFTNAYKGDVVIPSEVESGGKTYIVSAASDGVFRASNGLTSISIPSTLTQLGSSPFASCSNLSSINVEAGNPSYSSKDGVLLNASGNTLISCPGGKRGKYTVPGTVSIVADSSFQGCTGITEIALPSSVTKIGSYAFDRCSSLTSINLPSSLSEICDGTFQRCQKLSQISLPSSLKRIGKRAFYYCTNLSDLSLPSSLEILDDYALAVCTHLPTLVLPESLQEIGSHCFENCRQIESITIPGKVKSVGVLAFGGCSSLESIGVSSDNAEYISDNGALLTKDMTHIVCYPAAKSGDYTLPSQVTDIDDYAFYYCRQLNKVELSPLLHTIGEGSFMYCSGLEELSLPPGLVSIGGNAFAYCSSLQKLTSYPQSLPLFSSEAFTTDMYTSAKVYVHEHVLNMYKNDNYWGKFSSINPIGIALGDVNVDGYVSVTDITMTATHILGNAQDGFFWEFGDMNGDGIISVTDITMMATKILSE